MRIYKNFIKSSKNKGEDQYIINNNGSKFFILKIQRLKFKLSLFTK